MHTTPELTGRMGTCQRQQISEQTEDQYKENKKKEQKLMKAFMKKL